MCVCVCVCVWQGVGGSVCVWGGGGGAAYVDSQTSVPNMKKLDKTVFPISVLFFQRQSLF